MKKVYIIRDANGDADQTFLVEGGLDGQRANALSQRLSKIGYYLDSETVRGDLSQLVQRITTLEKIVKDQS